MGRGKTIQVASGQKVGHLTAVRFSHKDVYGRNIWVCECECGNVCEKPLACLTKRSTPPSCGCIRYPRKKPILKHDYRGEYSYHYRVWTKLKRMYSLEPRWYNFDYFVDAMNEFGFQKEWNIVPKDVFKKLGRDNFEFVPRSETFHKQKKTRTSIILMIADALDVDYHTAMKQLMNGSKLIWEAV